MGSWRDHLAFKLRFQLRLEPARPNELGRYVALPGSSQDTGVRDIAQHQYHAPRYLAALARIENRLAIRAIPRAEHPDAQWRVRHGSFLVEGRGKHKRGLKSEIFLAKFWAAR
jgi:hypothetical protein